MNSRPAMRMIQAVLHVLWDLASMPLAPFLPQVMRIPQTVLSCQFSECIHPDWCFTTRQASESTSAVLDEATSKACEQIETHINAVLPWMEEILHHLQLLYTPMITVFWRLKVDKISSIHRPLTFTLHRIQSRTASNLLSLTAG